MADFGGATPTVREADLIGSIYRRDFQDRSRDRAIRIKYIADLPAEHGSLNNAINRFVGADGYRYHSDGSLPLRACTTEHLGPHSVVLRAEYGRFPNQPDPNLGNSFQASSWRPGSRSVRWIQLSADADGNATIGTVQGGIEGVTGYPNGPLLGNTDLSSQRDTPRYWIWDIPVQNIYLPFYIESSVNPQDVLNNRANKVNDIDVTLDGVNMLAGQLLFSNYTLDKIFVNGISVYHGTYHFIYSRLGFVEQYPVFKPETLDPPAPAQWVAVTAAPNEASDIYNLPGV